MSKHKIFNDPLYGFISIQSDLIFNIIQHPFFQRLRRIKQLGLTELVYPGANHSRFQHALGAMHLMELTLKSLRNKGYDISHEEYEGALIAILLHDIGHGPFSHVLENSILQKVSHELLSKLFMVQLNVEFNGKLTLAIKIFTDQYERLFFHQLVSSQLDTDRLDYLNRDSYFTGVFEGIVSAERLINTFEIINDEIAIQEKGIYSVENFLNSRRLMYWQVYLHKTTISAEEMLIQIVRRAKYLIQNGENMYCSTYLKPFLVNDFSIENFENNANLLFTFGKLDDIDIWSGIKEWANCNDLVLNLLCNRLLDRNLFKVILSKEKFSEEYLLSIDTKIFTYFAVDKENSSYLKINGELSNYGYIPSDKKINILKKNGELIDITYASDLPNIKAMSEIVKKYYLCCPTEAFIGFFK